MSVRAGSRAAVDGARGKPQAYPLAHPGRFLVLPYVVLTDLVRDSRPARPLGIAEVDAAIAAGIGWLCRTHDVTGRNGCSKGFSYVNGWMAQFPETTGYIIGTLLERARLTGDDSLVARAIEMGDWELEVQNEDGGVIVGLLATHAKPSTVFNTGMVMHGWLDLYELTGEDSYLAAAMRGGGYLVDTQDTDGAWRGACEYRRVAHTYSSRVSWALLRLAATTGDSRYEECARRQLDWVLMMQRDNGWFDAAAFAPDLDPNTHVLAYTTRGLLESSVILEHEPYLAAAARTADALIRRFRELGRLPATFDRRWEATSRHECVTGVAQLGGIWLRLYRLTGRPEYLAAGADALAQATSRQSRIAWEPIHGAVPGSYPIFGRYAPLQYPNWATKFLVDSLMLYREILAAPAV
jgi:hypothetical protein